MPKRDLSNGGEITGYRVLGQPALVDMSLASRCPDPNARFNFSNAHGGMFGPAGIAVDCDGRLYVTDYGGQRVLTWADVDVLKSCETADGVIGSGELSGPEAVVVDPTSGIVFVADTLSHTVNGYRRDDTRAWSRVVQLGTDGVEGNTFGQFHFPRGLVIDPEGRLFVADDFNNRVLIFDPPFTAGALAADSIGAGGDGGFAHPKGLAMRGQTLFVADYDNNRVLRFTGPFDTPEQVYASTGSFTGLSNPVDLAVHPDGSLLVTDQGNRRIARYDDAVWAGSAAAPSSSFSDNISQEPLGVTCDRAGRIYIADYRSFRVLIRDEQLRTTSIGSESSALTEALLADLHTRPARSTGRVAIGQQLITWLNPERPRTDPDAWYKDWLKLELAGLPLPKVMGGELSELATNAIDELIQHGQAGNIVALVWHPDHPNGGNFNTPISTSDLRAMIDKGTVLGQNWKNQLDGKAAVLQAFKDANVPVLFRPLHEQNGNFFWWGHDGSKGADLRDRQAAWVALWRDMVTKLTVDKGLDNLLFVFGTNQVNFDGVSPPLTYYPGASWADVVGIDVYSNELNLAGGARGRQHYAALVGTGKPFGLAEFGQSFTDAGTGPNASSWDARTLLQRIRDTYQRTAFATAWYSSVENGVSFTFALPDVAFVSELLGDPLIESQ